MSIKSRMLYRLMLFGKKEFQKAIAAYDPASHTLEKDVGRAQEARVGFHRFSQLVTLMSHSPRGVVLNAISRAGVRTVVLTPKTPNDKLVLYIHGGAFALSLEGLHEVFAAHLAKETSSKVCLVDYRLAPEYPFPAGLDDIYAVYMDYLREQYDPKKIIIMGDSAGGNLSLALLLKLKQEGAPLPGAVIPLSPLADFHMASETYTTKAEADPVLPVDPHQSIHFTYLRGESPENPLVSPLFGDFTGFPPMLILVGAQEILLQDSINVAKKAKDAGVDVTLDIRDELYHVYPLFVGILDDAKIAMGKIALFINMKVG